MKKELLQQATNLSENRKRKKGWQRFVQMLALCVVFCTTYVLILPAITIQEKPICGHAEHTHTDQCSMTPRAELVNCGIPEGNLALHRHEALCFDEDGALICSLPERLAHTHGEDCYTLTRELACPAAHDENCQHTETVLTCELPESRGHTHTESCTVTQTVLTCALGEHTHGPDCYGIRTAACEIPESEEHSHTDACTKTVLECVMNEHTHGDGCFETQAVVCTLPETQGHAHGEGCRTVTEIPCTEPIPRDHVHTEECYLETRTLTCTRQELGLHSHTESCYEGGTPVCGRDTVVAHSHTEACLSETTAEPVLTCGLEEHIHDTVCYPMEEEPVLGPEYLCGTAPHAHIESCYENGVLTCTVPRHDHEAACLVAGLDLNADVENEKDWMRSVSGMIRTGNWPDDVVAVARTQLGYRESVKNVVLKGDDLKGYTRYGAWYGDPYGDWCAMYASFCLRYAGVEDYPLESGTSRWIEVLTEEGFYETSDRYTGKPGDLIFFDQDQKRNALKPIAVDADHVGIVVELIPAGEDTPAKIKTIEGNTRNQVAYNTYELDDPTIIGYGKVPFGEKFTLTHAGPDYTVTVTVGKDALIPESAQLAVREIERGTAEYDTYYGQSLAALKAEDAAQVTFARFFDISFVVGDMTIEPEAPVEIEIVYTDAVAMNEAEAGQIVHFASDGVEVLRPETSLTEGEVGKTEGVDTFRFTQDSFSVTGTLVAPRAVNTTATRVDPWEIDNTGNTMYVLVGQINGQYYALSGAENSYPVAVTVSGNTVTLPADNTQLLFWTFVDKPNDNTDYRYVPVANVGSGRYLHPFNNGASNQNITTGNPYDVDLVVSNDTFKIRGANNNFVRFGNPRDKAHPSTDQNNATSFFPAAVGSGGQNYNVWFDGTLGGMMSYYGAANTNIPAAIGQNGTALVELPETWQSTPKYDYKLRGWYDINTHIYYPVDPDDNIRPTATVSGNTVFYADWIAATYDVGQDNERVVESLDTSDFITTHVFDYNVLFNVLSQYHTGTISAGGHSETWSIYNNGERVPHDHERSLGFAFVDYDADGDFSYARDRDITNVNQGTAITAGILDEVRRSSGKDLLDLLFDPETEVIGKYYAGTGNYLFQYMDSTTANFDGEHDGYYYLDARLNAASYNQSQERFYLYNYLERTSDSRKDGGAGQYSDLLPFNSPYIFEAGQVDQYTDTIRRPGYEYDAKDGASGYQEYNSVDDAATNYFFGLRSDIEFFLPNDTNTQDEYGNYGNISTRGEHMIFDFHGDDDVWVFVDGELLLDIGGLHGIMHGQIDFSTGTIAYGADGSENVTTFHLDEGTHHMTVYYMERGSSQSNCAIYFNIAPRYDLEITKEDIVTADKLDGAVFSIFNDEAMTDPAELWNSFAEHEAGAEPTNTFTVVDGVARCWGISAGKTYYICETTPPPGYPESDDMIRITLNNRGTATIETTTLHGQNGVATEGFAVIKQNVNDTLKIVALTVTNQLEGDTTEVRVKKIWDEGSVVLPEYITVYLTADGVRIGRTARLNESNGWSYTWTGLPKYRGEGIDEEIEYVVEEVFVPDYITVQGESQKVENYVDWVQVGQMSDSKTFLLVHNGKALTCNGAFGWMDLAEAKNDTGGAAHWVVTTDHDGFHLKNELGYTLTYGNGRFYGVDNDAVALNQVIYYLNSRLMVHDHDAYYQFGTDGAAVQADGLTFQLYQKETLTGLLTNIVNRPVDEERQTFVEVSKVWADGAERHTGDAVVIRLWADGKDTGRYLILNADNNWQGSFDDLPYYQDGTDTPIAYTVVEDKLQSYVPSYSEGEIIQARPVSFWKNTLDLEAGGVYRIYARGYALAVGTDNKITTAANDPEDQRQQWTVESSRNSLFLKNVETGRYLRLNGSDLTTAANNREASAVSMNNGYLTVGGRYLELGSGYAAVTDNVNNVDLASLRLARWTQSTGMEGLGYTVTNSKPAYLIPETGASGTTSHYTFGSLLIVSAFLMCIHKSGRKRQKGGMYAQ